jgi:hypothetical protein
MSRSRFALQGSCKITEKKPLIGSQPKSVTTLLSLSAVAYVAATGRGGRPPHASTLVRWITKGTRLRDGSRLRLRALRTPGGWRVAEDSLYEFYDALTRDRLGVDAHDDAGFSAAATAATPRRPSPVRRSAAEHRAASEKAAEFLRQLDPD